MKDFWHYKDQLLHGGDTDLLTLAQQFGTPCYVYSQTLIEEQWNAYQHALHSYDYHLFYAVKANSNLAILQLLARLGAGFDIVSAGELQRVLKAGGAADKIVFSGVGKTRAEVELALRKKIRCFNVESLAELDRIQEIALQQDVQAPVSFRINPNVDANTHHYISTGLKENKFGIPLENARDIYRYAKSLSHISIVGVDCHIGSQITQLDPFIAALDNILELVDLLEKDAIVLSHINMGGGLGVQYQQETPPTPEQLVNAFVQRLGSRKISLSLEPGRSIVANAGVLLTQVEYIKTSAHKNFAIIDAGMNDLIRPALYDAWQTINAVELKPDQPVHEYDVVGPVCESADFLGKQRRLAISQGDYLAVMSAGAYGFVMSSHYNSRPQAAEVLLTPSGPVLIRERETLEDLWNKEILL